MKYQYGNLVTLGINNEFDVIVHGCNIYNTMGRGIALEIKNRLPQAYQADQKTIKGDRKKLGTYTCATINNLTVVNAYTQATYWDARDMLDYGAVQKVLAQIAKDFPDKRIGVPLIGCGLAFGNWGKISRYLKDSLPDATVVVFNKKDFIDIVNPYFGKDDYFIKVQ